MTYKYEKKLNKEHCYLLFITIIAIVSIVGNAYQDKYYSSCIKSYEQEAKKADSSYAKLEMKYKKMNDKLEIITDEYNELLEKNK